MAFQKWHLRSFIALVWLGSISFFILRDWNPLQLHPLSLFFREFSAVPSDFIAAFIKIYSSGLQTVLWIIVFACASAGAGKAVLCPVKTILRPGQYLLCSVAIGMALLGYITFFIGLFGWYSLYGNLLLWSIVGIFSAAGAVHIWRIAHGQKNRFCYSFCFNIFLTVFLFVFLFLFAKGLWPNVFYDSIVYHLGVPNYYLQEGKLSYIPYDAFSNFPFLTEMLYTAGLFLCDLKAAQSISVFIFFILVLSVYSFSTAFLTSVPAWLPALFCLAVPSFMEAAIFCGNDLAFTVYLLWGVYCFFEWENTENCSWLTLAGCFFGLCAGTKYTALIFVPILSCLGLSYSVYTRKKGFIRPFIKYSCMLFLPAMIVFLPWLAKNFIWTSNPFYPAFYPLFDGRDMTLEQSVIIQHLSHPPNLQGMLKGLWRHPIMLSFGRPEVFATYGLQWNIGPIILLFTPLLLVVKGIPRVVKKIIIIAVLLFVLWNMTFIIARFLYPAIVFSLILAAYAVTMLLRKSILSLKIVLTGAVAGYVFVYIVIGMYQINTRTMTQGFNFLKESDDRHLRRHMMDDTHAVLDSYPVYAYINENLSPNALVLIIGDAQHLYIQRRHRYAYLSASTPYDIFKTEAGLHDANISAKFKAEGITHILYNPVEMVRLQQARALPYSEDNNRFIESFLAGKYVKRIYTYRRPQLSVGLYELL
jgi:hypothetical protein